MTISIQNKCYLHTTQVNPTSHIKNTLELCHDLLLEIFRFFTPQDLAILRLTCRNWHLLVQDPKTPCSPLVAFQFFQTLPKIIQPNLQTTTVSYDHIFDADLYTVCCQSDSQKPGKTYFVTIHQAMNEAEQDNQDIEMDEQSSEEDEALNESSTHTICTFIENRVQLGDCSSKTAPSWSMKTDSLRIHYLNESIPAFDQLCARLALSKINQNIQEKLKTSSAVHGA